MARDRANYGVDGGYVVIPYFALVEVGLLAAGRRARKRDRQLAAVLARAGAAAMLGVALGYWYSTGPGKLSVWRDCLTSSTFGATSACSISAAAGADIWRLRDQTGNSRAAAERNARIEGVSDRVEFVEADARHLPFLSNSYDVVVSNLTFDNIHGKEQRANALREAVRVLRPGGRIRIVDDRAGRDADVLRAAGCPDVDVRRLDWRMWFGLPGHHLVLVAASKPAAGTL